MRQLKVKSKAGDYAVVVGSGAWRDFRRFPSREYSSIFVLTEKKIWDRWQRQFTTETGLKRHQMLFVEPGEKSKELPVLSRLASELLNRGGDRRSLLILLGGGVVGDLGGFLASVYMRGIDYVNCPTTVLSQVDSAIGGKTAVNLDAAKNLVGSFCPARQVLADSQVLESLSPRDLRSGLYEVVKHGILDGPQLFSLLERRLGDASPQNLKIFEPLLVRAAKVKVDIVNRDEREKQLRFVLNLGHTFGHAFEEATDYRRFLHGEAVAWGLLGVIRLSERLHVIDTDASARIRNLILKLGPLPSLSPINPTRVLALLSKDKKTIGGHIHWVIPERIGRVRIRTDVPMRAAAAALKDLIASAPDFSGARPRGSSHRE
jgi:3-dehydroquinate synthase